MNPSVVHWIISCCLVDNINILTVVVVCVGILQTSCEQHLHAVVINAAQKFRHINVIVVKLSSSNTRRGYVLDDLGSATSSTCNAELFSCYFSQGAGVLDDALKVWSSQTHSANIHNCNAQGAAEEVGNRELYHDYCAPNGAADAIISDTPHQNEVHKVYDHADDVEPSERP